MGCVSPLIGWRSRQLNPSGKRGIVFNKDYGYADMEVKVPCGQCWRCRLEQSRQWAIRCVHEAQLHRENSFITLTYNPENLPENGTLVKKDFQDFMKNFRLFLEENTWNGSEYKQNRKIKVVDKKNGDITYRPIKCYRKVRYFHCGEYGSERDKNGEIIKGRLGRPHYHAIIFGYQFEDLEYLKTKKGVDLFTSPKLEEIWGKGFVTVGSVTFESAAYVARYVMKKRTGDEGETHYLKEGPNGECGPHGELCYIQPEYTTMSRRPGIAHDWFMAFKDDLKKDFITINGKKFQPPKYYDTLFEIHDQDHLERVKARRISKAKNSEENDPDRKEQIEKVKKAQLNMLIREYEEIL